MLLLLSREQFESEKNHSKGLDKLSSNKVIQIIKPTQKEFQSSKRSAMTGVRKNKCHNAPAFPARFISTSVCKNGFHLGFWKTGTGCLSRGSNWKALWCLQLAELCPALGRRADCFSFCCRWTGRGSVAVWSGELIFIRTI